MTYQVIGEDGKKYGPAVIDDLRRWLADGRIQGTTIVEDETGVRCPLSEVAGLEPPAGSTGSPTWTADVSIPVVPQRSGTTWVIAALIGCGVVFVGVFILASVMFPVFAQAKFKAQQAMSLRHARELGRAVLLYAEDNGGRLPLDLSSANAARPAIRQYVTDDLAFTTSNPNGGEFLGNSLISGTDLNSYGNADKIVLFYESIPWSDRKRGVVWLDGHEKMVSDFDPVRDLGRK